VSKEGDLSKSFAPCIGNGTWNFLLIIKLSPSNEFQIFCLGFCKVKPSYGLICNGSTKEDLAMTENDMISH